MERVKTCEFHFKQCRNRQARKFHEETRRQFRSVSEALLEAQSPTSYEKANEKLEKLYIGGIRTDEFENVVGVVEQETAVYLPGIPAH